MGAAAFSSCAARRESESRRSSRTRGSRPRACALSAASASFSLVDQIVRPVLPLLDGVPDAQARALRAALGHAPEPVGNRFLVAAGLLSLLAEAADEQPTLCLVDDAQWADLESAEALRFVARRLRAERMAILFAVRDEREGRFDWRGLPEISLEGLDDEDAGRLLAERLGPGVASEVRHRLLEAARGNPLALLELGAALSPAQLTGREPLVGPIEIVGEGRLGLLERAYLNRVRRLPRGSQTVLLLAAAEDTGEAAAIVAAAGAMGLGLPELGLAEAAGLVEVNGSVRFRHPLVRSAVYRGATIDERCAAHRALAEALSGEADADRRAWHRAAATLGRDDDVAAELERSAERARRRGGYAASSAALARAAELSSGEESAARRLAAASEAAWLAGRLDHALTLTDRAARLPADRRTRAALGYVRGSIEMQRGILPRAAEVLADAAEDVVEVDARRALEIVVAAVDAGSMQGTFDRPIDIGLRAAERLDGGLSEQERFTVAFLRALKAVLLTRTPDAAEAVRQALDLAATSRDPRVLNWGGSAAAALGDHAGARALHERAVAEARSLGAAGMLPFLLLPLAYRDAVDRRTAAAAANASDALTLARETGQETLAAAHLATLARVAAFRGDEAECRSRAEEALRGCLEHGLGFFAAVARMALAELELSLGHLEEALHHLEELAQVDEALRLTLANLGDFVEPDLVYAAVRVGRRERAEQAFARLEALATATPFAASSLVSRCRGLISAPEVAERHFQEALRLDTEQPASFERARTELAYGELLRRSRRRAEAREHLRSALETFERMGAALWANHARAELRATGETARKRDPSTLDQLTPQELQIARLVGTGATNRDIAAQLFLSPRTVDYHLRKVFVKLGISSRAELIRGALGAAGETVAS
jgi:DNA-binding CsgD family transcriptional regulator